MLEVEEVIKGVLPYLQCTLVVMSGIDIVTAANILSEIGNIERLPNVSKPAKFVGIAPVNFSSVGKGRDMRPKQGNRWSQAVFYFPAIQTVQIAPNGTARHPVFRECFQRKQEEGKSKQQR